jgi:hypothetical protein
MASRAEDLRPARFAWGKRIKITIDEGLPLAAPSQRPGETTARKMRGITAALGTDDFPPGINRPQRYSLRSALRVNHRCAL